MKLRYRPVISGSLDSYIVVEPRWGGNHREDGPAYIFTEWGHVSRNGQYYCLGNVQIFYQKEP